jgi:activator of HSP90 ATPase
MKTILQKVKFKASPEDLFELVMDSKKHSLATGSKAVVSRKIGGAFSAHGGYCRGKNLMIVPNAMVVQTWCSQDWAKKDRDSLLILHFEKAKGGGRVTMIHANVPDRQAASLAKGWKTFYWKPWARYLSRKK